MSAEEELYELACQDMPVGGDEVREVMDRWAQELTDDLKAELARERKSVSHLHDGLNLLFKEALQLRNENRRLRKRVAELEKTDGA